MFDNVFVFWVQILNPVGRSEGCFAATTPENYIHRKNNKLWGCGNTYRSRSSFEMDGSLKHG